MRHRLTPLLATALLTITACGGDSSGPSDCKMTAQLNGQEFCGLFLSVERNGGQVFVNSGASGQRAIGFTFPDTGPGTYQIVSGSLVAAGVTIGTDSYTAGGGTGSGTLVITAATGTRTAGTFELTAVAGAATATVTQGAFDSEW